MRYMTPAGIAAFAPDPPPDDGAAMERARRAMQNAGCATVEQQMGSRWPIGCVALEITQRCNLDCTLCYLSEHSEAVKDIPIDEIYRRIDLIGQYYGPGTDVQITGGEPTLRRRDELLAIVRRARERGLRPTLMTNGRGEVDFHRLASERADLDGFLEYVARVSPRTAPALFPDKDAALAYYINAYNALSMVNVIDSGFPKSLGGLNKVWFFGFKRFSVGGERMSLYALENDLIRPFGDARVHFALNCMSVSCPRLPREPFRADDLNRQLDDAAREFFADSRNLQVVPERKLVRASSILEFYTGDFLAQSPTLIDYIDKYASKSIPGDYRIEFLDYDWTVNVQRSRSHAKP